MISFLVGDFKPTDNHEIVILLSCGS